MVGDTVVVLVVDVVLQLYVSAPVAIKTTGLPAQVAVLDVTICGKVFTSIVMVCVTLEQFDASPITV